jgi:hypothetical protein
VTRATVLPRRWKLHQRAAPPFGPSHTVCGLPATGRGDPIIVPSLQGTENDCRNCVRLLATKTRKEGPPK